MAHTSRGRVILGGLLAGLVINVIEFIANGLVLEGAWAAAMKALGKPVAFGLSQVMMFNLWGFLLGIAAVWLYAAIRPRYGAGVTTAARAGIAVWVLANFLPNVATLPMGLFPSRLIVFSIVIGLVEVVVATILGAWIYREETATAAQAAKA